MQQVDVVLGLQRGDEGKGRVVDALTNGDGYDVVARFNGGPNAGHTISLNGIALALHQVPSGVRNPRMLNLIGNGALVDLVRLSQEADELQAAGLEVSQRNLVISYAAHLVLPHHIALDEAREAGPNGQGSTKRGIAFAASDKYRRSGVRAEILADSRALRAHAEANLRQANELLVAQGMEPYDLRESMDVLLAAADRFVPYVGDTVAIMHERLARGERVIAEGAQAASLDIDHGPYPYVSSSSTTIGGVLTGLGIGSRDVGEVFGVIKAVKSHVGDGPFPTEEQDSALSGRVRGKPGRIDSEYGKATGRPRRIGHLDLPEIRHAIQVSGVTQLVLTKLDCVPQFGSEARIATAYRLGYRLLSAAPTSVAQLAECQPVYHQLATWQEDIGGVDRYEDLPEAARQYVEFLETQLGARITMIGVGPHANQLIRR